MLTMGSLGGGSGEHPDIDSTHTSTAQMAVAIWGRYLGIVGTSVSGFGGGTYYASLVRHELQLRPAADTSK